MADRILVFRGGRNAASAKTAPASMTIPRSSRSWMPLKAPRRRIQRCFGLRRYPPLRWCCGCRSVFQARVGCPQPGHQNHRPERCQASADHVGGDLCPLDRNAGGVGTRIRDGVRMLLFETVVFEDLVAGGVQPGLTHAVYEVDDLDAEYARIRALGARGPDRADRSGGGFRQVPSRLSSGFVFEVMQVLEQRFEFLFGDKACALARSVEAAVLMWPTTPFNDGFGARHAVRYVPHGSFLRRLPSVRLPQLSNCCSPAAKGSRASIVRLDHGPAGPRLPPVEHVTSNLLSNGTAGA